VKRIPFARQSVEIRRGDVFVSIAAQRRPTHVISEDVEDIGWHREERWTESNEQEDQTKSLDHGDAGIGICLDSEREFKTLIKIL